MIQKFLLVIREICWVIATVLLYATSGWLAWEIWSATLIAFEGLGALIRRSIALLLIFCVRRKLFRIVVGPLYRDAAKAYMIGAMRHT